MPMSIVLLYNDSLLNLNIPSSSKIVTVDIGVCPGTANLLSEVIRNSTSNNSVDSLAMRSSVILNSTHILFCPDGNVMFIVTASKSPGAIYTMKCLCNTMYNIHCRWRDYK